ncbi:DNA repair protein, partial [Xylella fastidiosa subsp. multiplex]|nr:DNA repair protein [Xylella fastidiosa subsp. multiplex]
MRAQLRSTTQQLQQLQSEQAQVNAAKAAAEAQRDAAQKELVGLALGLGQLAAQRLQLFL